VVPPSVPCEPKVVMAAGLATSALAQSGLARSNLHNIRLVKQFACLVGRLDAGCHSESADARQLQRRSTDIKPEDGTKKVDLKAFDPTDRKTKIAPQ
jgi:hypothetical protein